MMYKLEVFLTSLADTHTASLTVSLAQASSNTLLSPLLGIELYSS